MHVTASLPRYTVEITCFASAYGVTRSGTTPEQMKFGYRMGLDSPLGALAAAHARHLLRQATQVTMHPGHWIDMTADGQHVAQTLDDRLYTSVGGIDWDGGITRSELSEEGADILAFVTRAFERAGLNEAVTAARSRLHGYEIDLRYGDVRPSMQQMLEDTLAPAWPDEDRPLANPAEQPRLPSGHIDVTRVMIVGSS